MSYTKLIIILLLIFNNLIGQYVQQISVKDGLSSSSANKIYQDKKGYLWIATINGGLNRYDGKQTLKINDKADFYTFLTLSYLPVNDTLSYVGTELGIYTLTNNKTFKKFKTDSLQYQVTDIKKSLKGKYYFTTTRSVISIFENQITNYYVNEKNVMFYEVIFFNEDVYFASSNGLYVLKGKNVVKVEIPELLNVRVKAGIQLNDTLVLGTSQGLLFLNKNKIVKKFDISNSNLLSNKITAFYKSSDGNIWIGSAIGLYKYKNGKLECFNEKNGIPQGVISSIIEDFEGNILFSTLDGGGVYLFIERQFKVFNEKHGLINTNILSLSGNTNKQLYFLTPSNIYKFHKEKDSIETISIPLKTQKFRFVDFEVTSDNNLWILNEDNKLLFYSKNNLQENYFFKNFRITSIECDSKNNLFVGTNSGLYLLDKITSIPKLINIENQTIHNFIINIENIKDDALYVFTGMKIIKISNTDSIYATYKILNKNGIYSNYIAKDYNSNLYIKCHHGLIYINTKTNDTIDIQKLVDFSTLTIKSIYCYQNYLFALGESGLHIINIKNIDNNIVTYKSFGVNDGLPCNELMANRNFIDSDGMLWLGTKSGLVKFNFNQETSYQFNPKVIVQGIEINHENTDWNIRGLKQFNESTNAIKLKHFENTLTFKYVGVHFLNPSKIKYNIQLIENGKRTSFNTNLNEATFSNLKAGEYTFIVSIINPYTNEVGVNTKVTFTIIPPFYKTKLFIATIVLLSLLLLIFFIRYREKSIKKKNLYLQSLVKERTIDLELKNEELNVTNILLAKRNENITESLEYSKKLQHNILNLNTSFNKELESAFNYSLFYKQKELVGGDFYSVFRQENAMYIIVADCTGHGVPGALMTILSYTILKQIIIDEKVSYPSDILKRMNTILINSFKDENGIYSNDGVAISLMKYDLENSLISFSCAQQSVFILNNDLTVEELKFNSTPLNYKISEAYYETKQLNNIKGQKIIMFSDGIIDQKIEKSKLRIRKPGLIEIIKNRTNDKDYYKNSVLNLSGNAEQIDDMLLIELEIKIK